MSRATAAKMSLEASDVQTDEDCEDLVEDGFSFSADMSEHEKRTRRKRSSGKPPPSPRSPYLSSLNMNPRRVAVAAWRLPRASLGDTRGGREDTFGETASPHLASLSNGHDLSQTVRTECDVTSEFFKQTLTMRKHKQPHSASIADYREKEDMYDEIIRLKKSLQAQRSDNKQMKAKLRRLEEDKTKREKQIEELLDPTKGSEYTRSLVDKKKEGSVVLYGLKQRILKLEQQCREKENALSKLQSELRTTNLEELKITVDTYFEEIQRLRLLLQAAEKSSRAESKCSQRQQKALSSTVLRLSENLKQLQQENIALREELNTDSPIGGIKGYREWSKQRLVRRLLEVEKRLEDSRRHTQSAKSSGRLDQEIQTTPTEILGITQGVTMATEAAVSVGMTAEEGEEISALRGQLEKERVELQETLTSKDDQLRRLRAEREETEKETKKWKAEQTNEREKERREHKQELDRLWVRIQNLEGDRSKPARVELSSPSTTPENHENTQAREGLEEGEKRETEEEKQEERERGEQKLGRDAEEKRRSEDQWKKEREKAARIIQTNWREHRDRDTVMVQSALRGHLLRETQLKDLRKDTHNKAIVAKNRSDASSADGELDVVALAMIQSAFRGHLARCGLATQSSESSMPSLLGNSLPTLAPSTQTPSRTGCATPNSNDEKEVKEEDPWPVSHTHSSRMKLTPAQMELHFPPDSGGATAVDSDDSDDIIVSPSRPLRTREDLLL